MHRPQLWVTPTTIDRAQVIERMRRWCADHDRPLARLNLAVAISIPVLFLVLGYLRAIPFIDDVALNSNEGDDWLSYKILSHSILRDGLTMPVLGAYAKTVHGFLYNYFLAGVFFVFGENSTYAYVVQSLLLGASVPIFAMLVWRRLSRIGLLLLLIVSALYVYVDLYRNIGFRLLSENLFVFLFAVAIVAYVQSQEERARWWSLASGLLLGIAILTRTSAVAFAVVLLVAGALWALRTRRPLLVPALAAIGFVAGMSLLPLREWAATGRPDIDLILHTGDWVVPPTDSVGAFLLHYARRTAFTLGFTQVLQEAYSFRPYWLVIWIGFFGYLADLIRRRRRLELWELSLLLYLFFYLGPVIALGYPDNYGARMVVIAVPTVIMLAAVYADRLVRGRVAASARA